MMGCKLFTPLSYVRLCNQKTACGKYRKNPPPARGFILPAVKKGIFPLSNRFFPSLYIVTFDL